MPQLNSNNSVNIQVASTNDNSGVDEAARGLGTLDKAAKETSETFGTKLEGASRSAGIALAATGAAFTAISKVATNSTVDYTKSVVKLSRETGETTETTSKLLYAMQRTGLGAEEASASFGIFSRNIQNASEQTAQNAVKQADLNNKIQQTKEQISVLTEEQKKHGDSTGLLQTKIQGLNINLQQYQQQIDGTKTVFEKLGVAVKNTDGTTRGFGQILLDVADKFKSMPDGVEKTASAMALFGRQGKDLIPILDKGSAGIQELETQADKLGLTLTQSNVAAVMKYSAAQKDMKDAQQALTLQIGQEALPMWTKFYAVQNGLVRSLLDAPAPIHDTTVAVSAFGGPVFTAAGGVLGLMSNLDQSMPMLGKFGGGLTAITSKLGPWGLALTAVGLVAVGVAAHYGLLNKLLGDNSEKSTTAAGSANMLTLFQEAQARAADNVRTAVTNLTSSQKDLNDAYQVNAQKNQLVSQAQGQVKQALDKFGQDSPQYKLAVDKLTGAQLDLNSALFDQADKLLTVQGNELALRDANDKLSASINTLTGFQNNLNRSLDITGDTIANFGPIANMQVAPIANLGRNMDEVVARFGANAAKLDGQVGAINDKLQGLNAQGSNVIANLGTGLTQLGNSTIKFVQNANSQLQGVQSNINSLQGATGTAPVKRPGQNAKGSSWWRGGPTWVGEEGPELINLPAGTEIKSNRDSQAIVNSSVTTQASKGDSVNVHFYGNVDLSSDQKIDDVAKRLGAQMLAAKAGAF